MEGLAEILWHRLQQPPRIVQQLQQRRDRLTSPLHLGVADLGQALVDRCQLITQPPHLDFEPVLRPFRVPDQIEQAVLLVDQPVPLGSQIPPQRGREQALLPQRLVDGRLQFSRSRGRDVQGRIVSGDRSLHLRDRQPGRLAVFARLATAQEVRVHNAAPVLHRVEIKARTAVRAPQKPLQRMVVDTLASASATLIDEHVLNPVEQLLGDQWLMPAVVLLALEHDSTEIPPVAEQSTDGLDGHRPTVGHVLPRASPQPRLRDGSLEVLEAVAPSRVELEHHDDEGRPLSIDGDCPHFAAVDPLPHVQVPERSDARDASTRCLRGHLVGDVRPGSAGLVLVDAVEDRGHQVADVAVLRVIHNRDQLNAELPKLPASDRRVGGVAMHARAGVDDDRVHVLAVPDSRHHLLELRSPVHGHRRSTWLDVLLDHLHPELFSFP